MILSESIERDYMNISKPQTYIIREQKHESECERFQVQSSLGNIWLLDLFLYFHVVKSLMPILPLLPISAMKTLNLNKNLNPNKGVFNEAIKVLK